MSPEAPFLSLSPSAAFCVCSVPPLGAALMAAGQPPATALAPAPCALALEAPLTTGGLFGARHTGKLRRAAHAALSVPRCLRRKAGVQMACFSFITSPPGIWGHLDDRVTPLWHSTEDPAVRVSGLEVCTPAAPGAPLQAPPIRSRPARWPDQPGSSPCWASVLMTS